MAQKLRNAEPIGGVILDDEEALGRSRCKFLHSGKRGFHAFVGYWLRYKRKSAACQTAPAILINREDLNRDMPRQGILLKLTEDGPAEHIWQENIQTNSVWPILFCQCHSVRAFCRDQ